MEYLTTNGIFIMHSETLREVLSKILSDVLSLTHFWSSVLKAETTTLGKLQTNLAKHNENFAQLVNSKISPYLNLVYKMVKIVDKSEHLDVLLNILNEDLLAKLLVVWDIDKEAKLQKECLRVLSKVSHTTVKLHNQNPEVSLSLGKKRALFQVLNYLHHKAEEQMWNDTVNNDINYRKSERLFFRKLQRYDGPSQWNFFCQEGICSRIRS